MAWQYRRMNAGFVLTLFSVAWCGYTVLIACQVAKEMTQQAIGVSQKRVTLRQELWFIPTIKNSYDSAVRDLSNRNT